MPLPPRPVIRYSKDEVRLPIAVLGHGQHELLGRGHLDVALLAELDRAGRLLLGVGARVVLLARRRAARRWRA